VLHGPLTKDSRHHNCSAEAFQQTDGNLVIRDTRSKLVWTTQTSHNDGSRLVIDDGGRLSVIRGETVIWMQGLPRGTYDGPSSPDLQYPLRGTFYYPWYPETWGVNGRTAKFIPDSGLYSSDDPAIVEEHIDALEYAHVDVSIASWWGPGTNQDLARLNLLMDKTIELNSQIKWTVYYEIEHTENPAIDKIHDDLDYLRTWLAWHPAWAHIDGKPVIFVYNDSGGCDIVQRWMDAAQGEWYVVMKLIPRFRFCKVQPSHWHQYGPSNEYIHTFGASASISPGFWRADKAKPNLARLSKARFCENAQKMVRTGEDWQLITTFNEAGEGTLVEASSPNWGSDTKYGYYLDCLHSNH
jgi:Glycosyl hydrolase family 99